jgi:hypothetical protein
MDLNWAFDIERRASIGADVLFASPASKNSSKFCTLVSHSWPGSQSENSSCPVKERNHSPRIFQHFKHTTHRLLADLKEVAVTKEFLDIVWREDLREAGEVRIYT